MALGCIVLVDLRSVDQLMASRNCENSPHGNNRRWLQCSGMLLMPDSGTSGNPSLDDNFIWSRSLMHTALHLRRCIRVIFSRSWTLASVPTWRTPSDGDHDSGVTGNFADFDMMRLDYSGSTLEGQLFTMRPRVERRDVLPSCTLEYRCPSRGMEPGG
ncbi:hypothetical protein I7I51_00226 [Histoplasma capsulatum]|uniref:Uncharacterized protein n=1 Tax=Ajellomyces capsulatus TaxID=5037 RepID=A0A8A1MB55_AJECA|nr:hypothetical protein I7I51_00226 [Histoplasma capsulatum]